MDISNMPVTAKLILDLANHASSLENTLKDYLLPHPEGVYVINQLHPVIVAGKSYYTKKVSGIACDFIPIVDFDKCKEAVYDENHRLAVPATFMISKDKFLSNSPFLPTRGMRILELAIQDQINATLGYRPYRSSYWTKVLANLKPIVEPEEVESVEWLISNVYCKISGDISSFIGNDDWHYYSVETTGSKAIVKKFIDYRIFQWTQEHGHEFGL